MATTSYHFQALLKNIQPKPHRLELAKTLPGEVRSWLEEHDFETAPPHTRLTGSYARQVAIGDIKDVDVLLFVPAEEEGSTPNSILIRLKKLLDEYPNTVVTEGQRRSVRLEFPRDDLHLDIVPAILPDGLEKPLKVPDRPREEWIASDPLGYGRALSDANADHGKKLVPLIKLVKSWRDQNFAIRRPKSYLLEVLTYQAMTGGHLVWQDCSMAATLHSFYRYVENRWADLVDDGGLPRIHDPQLGNVISGGWERSHFETFMRRIGEAVQLSGKAVALEDEDRIPEAATLWSRLYGDVWPADAAVEALLRSEAASVQPGLAVVSSSGAVGGTEGVKSRSTRYHGQAARRGSR